LTPARSDNAFLRVHNSCGDADAGDSRFSAEVGGVHNGRGSYGETRNAGADMGCSVRKITVNMATMQSRRAGLQKRIEELAWQCDILRVYLNGFDDWPDDVVFPSNVEYVCGDGIQAPDMGVQGKLHWLNAQRDEYYLTVDDDIYYPEDYVAKITGACADYGNRAIVGYHATRFRIEDGQLPTYPRSHGAMRMLFYADALHRDTGAHMLGNATMCCVSSVLGLNAAEVIQPPVHSGDDGDMAVWAQRHAVPMVALKRRKSWLKADWELCMIDANHRTDGRQELQDQKLTTWTAWRQLPVPRRTL